MRSVKRPHSIHIHILLLFCSEVSAQTQASRRNCNFINHLLLHGQKPTYSYSYQTKGHMLLLDNYVNVEARKSDEKEGAVVKKKKKVKKESTQL